MQQELKCRHLIIKVASRCNLNCTYCYMYNAGDDTYKQQPKFMSPLVVVALLQRVYEHCMLEDIDSFTFVFHGGEPLLASPDFYRHFVENAHSILKGIDPLFKMQTNGTLLTEDWCKLFDELNISFGISLDGTREVNDLHRIDHAGKGSYDKVVKGFRLAQSSPYLKNKPGIASYINLGVPPLFIYQHFKDLEAGYIDFIFPDATHDTIPASLTDSDTPYADWLIPIFDDWFADKAGKPRIRLFEIILMLILGRDVEGGYDAIGTGMHEVMVIESDGSIEPIDSLKVCGNAFTKVGASVFTHGFGEALGKKLSSLNNLSHRKLCKQCMNCPIRDVCGGGYLSHRYSRYNGFNNPSIYCKDIIKLVTHLQRTVLNEIPLPLQQELGITAMSYEDILDELDAGNASAEEPDHIAELISFRKVMTDMP